MKASGHLHCIYCDCHDSTSCCYALINCNYYITAVIIGATTITIVIATLMHAISFKCNEQLQDFNSLANSMMN